MRLLQFLALTDSKSASMGGGGGGGCFKKIIIILRTSFNEVLFEGHSGI